MDKVKVQNLLTGVDCNWRSVNPRGGTGVRSWSQSVRKPWNYWMKRLQSCRQASFAKCTDTPMSGSVVKSHGWPKMGRLSSAKQIISCLLSFQGCLSILEAGRLLHRYHRDRWEQKQTNLWKQSCFHVIFTSSPTRPQLRKDCLRFKCQRLLAEDALAKPYFVQKGLVIG